MINISKHPIIPTSPYNHIFYKSMRKKFRISFIIIAIILGCSLTDNSPKIIKEELFLKYRVNLFDSRNKRPPGVFYQPRSLGVSYDPIKKHIIFSIDPKGPNLPSMFKVYLNKNELYKDSLNFNIQPFPITSGRINKIKVSPKNNYHALGGNSRDLIFYENYEIKFIGNLNRELTALQFDNKEKYLLSGDQSGNLKVFNIEKGQLIFSKNIFDGEITSIEFLSDNQALISGESSTILELTLAENKFSPFIETSSSSDIFLAKIGLRSCLKPKVTDLIIIPAKHLIATAHGWDNCSKNEIKLWDTNTKLLIQEFSLSNNPSRKMILSADQENIYIFDSGFNILKLDVKNRSIINLFNFKNSFTRFDPDKSMAVNSKNILSKEDQKKINNKFNPAINKLMGLVNDVHHIPNSNFYILSTGSPFMLGGAIILLEINGDSISHKSHLIIDGLMRFSLYLSKAFIN